MAQVMCTVVLTKAEWRDVVSSIEDRSSRYDFDAVGAKNGSVRQKAWQRNSDELEELAACVASQTGIER